MPLSSTSMEIVRQSETLADGSSELVFPGLRGKPLSAYQQLSPEEVHAQADRVIVQTFTDDLATETPPVSNILDLSNHFLGRFSTNLNQRRKSGTGLRRTDGRASGVRPFRKEPSPLRPKGLALPLTSVSLSDSIGSHIGRLLA